MVNQTGQRWDRCEGQNPETLKHNPPPNPKPCQVRTLFVLELRDAVADRDDDSAAGEGGARREKPGRGRGKGAKRGPATDEERARREADPGVGSLAVPRVGHA
jgi:hypothetical protein